MSRSIWESCPQCGLMLRQHRKGCPLNIRQLEKREAKLRQELGEVSKLLFDARVAASGMSVGQRVTHCGKQAEIVGFWYFCGKIRPRVRYVKKDGSLGKVSHNVLGEIK